MGKRPPSKNTRCTPAATTASNGLDTAKRSSGTTLRSSRMISSEDTARQQGDTDNM